MRKGKTWTILMNLAIAAVLIALLIALPAASARVEKKSHLTPVDNGWYYLWEGEKVPVQLPATISYPGYEALVLYNDSLTQADAGLTLTTRGIEHGLSTHMDGRTLYEYDDELFPRNDQMKSKYECDIIIPADVQVGELELRFEHESSGEYKLSRFYLGNGVAVMWRHFTNNAVPIILAFAFIMLSVIAIGIAVYLHHARINNKRFVDTAIFLFICSVWVFTDSSITQVQSGNYAAICIISFFAFMLLAVPMLFFIKHTAGMEKYRILDLFIWLFCLNALIQGIVNLTLHVDFRDMLFVTHLLLAAGVGVSIFLLVKEYQRNESRDIAMILIAFTLLGSSGVLAMALYWLLNIPFYGTIFEVGICLFVFILINSILTVMVENIRYKSEMQVYQRLLREDGMTGMESRQPFDDYLTAIQRSPANYKNAALIFFKVKNLKKINEESGHAAGDELILGAAKCISETFGKAGRCYRLKGDEFAVILDQSLISEEEWFSRFDLAIQKFNRNSPYWLSIARGWSDYRDDDGSLKTISNWKFCANNNMH